jgi:hypothetical protein
MWQHACFVSNDEPPGLRTQSASRLEQPSGASSKQQACDKCCNDHCAAVHFRAEGVSRRALLAAGGPVGR